ncbi:MAG: hypothetical protein FJ102_06865 [Deltaproteobacteria bacterium]|nr:hypothetical protein [Deltaproteobacteria bacterium]
MLLIVLGCAKAPPPVDSGGIDSGSRDTSDTATAGDSGDTGGFSVPVEPGPCGAWAGVQGGGTTWTYEPTEAYVAAYGFDGSFTTTADGAGEEWTLRSVGRYDSDTGYISWDRTDTLRCDAEGAWFTHSESTGESLSGTSTISQVGMRHFEPGWLIRPASLELGSAWSDDFTYSSEVNGVVADDLAVHCDNTVVAAEARELPVATLDALHVDFSCDNIKGPDGWLARHVGLVETDQELLTAFVP